MYGPTDKEWLVFAIVTGVFFIIMGAGLYKLAAWLFSHLSIYWI